MASKKLSVILYGADRQLWHGSSATLRVTKFDSHGMERLWIRTATGRRLKNVPLSGSIIEVNLDLQFDAGQIYAVTLNAKKHRPAWQLVNRRTFLRKEGSEEIERADAILRLMLVPRKPTSSDLDLGFDKLASRESPLVQAATGIQENEYKKLEPATKMALLNIEAKLRETPMGGRPIMSHITGLRHAAPDRLFVMMRAGVKELIERSADFVSAAGHEKPNIPGKKLPGHPDSWKHQVFSAGNIQLSFAAKSEAWPEGISDPNRSYSVDADIDLERGIKHWWEWLENNVFKPGQKTDQTVVYALLYSQGITPDYTLDQV